jgi:tRNA U38,U39,U40 pseudouridine synthase TruA
MIRFIVGTALFVTEKGLPAETIDSLLDENSPREIVSHKAPANGLTLIDVEY